MVLWLRNLSVVPETENQAMEHQEGQVSSGMGCPEVCGIDSD